MRRLTLAFDDNETAHQAVKELRMLNIPPARIRVEYCGPSGEEQDVAAALLHNFSVSVFTPIMVPSTPCGGSMATTAKVSSVLKVDALDASQAVTIRAVLQRFAPVDVSETPWPGGDTERNAR